MQLNLTNALGDASRIDEMRGNEVKGNLVLSRRWYLAERTSVTAMRNVMNAIPSATRTLLEGTIMPFSWVPFGPLIDIDLAIINEVMSGKVEDMLEFGHELGRRDASGIYRTFLAIPPTSFVLDKVSMLGSMYFRESTLGYESRGPGNGRVQLVGRSMPRYMCQYGITGWLVAILEVSKARNPSVEHVACVHRNAPTCRWECRWETRSRPRT